MQDQVVPNQQPKFIEKMIDKVEEVLTQPVSQSKGDKKQKTQKTQPHKQPVSDEYKLPVGTTITLPDGQSYVTKTESKIQRLEKGGEKK